jgi:hypothetical protein
MTDFERLYSRFDEVFRPIRKTYRYLTSTTWLFCCDFRWSPSLQLMVRP